jgi:hypothetical protein
MTDGRDEVTIEAPVQVKLGALENYRRGSIVLSESSELAAFKGRVVEGRVLNGPNYCVWRVAIESDLDGCGLSWSVGSWISQPVVLALSRKGLVRINSTDTG